MPKIPGKTTGREETATIHSHLAMLFCNDCMRHKKHTLAWTLKRERGTEILEEKITNAIASRNLGK
jgi:hypothetical protein